MTQNTSSNELKDVPPIRYFAARLKNVEGMKIFEGFSQPLTFTKFSVGTHASELPPSERFELFLAQEACGRLVTHQNGVEIAADVPTGTLSLAPAMMTAHYDFVGQTTNHIVSIHHKTIEQVISSDIGFTSIGTLEPSFGWRNPGIERMILRQFEILEKGDLGWRIQAEAMALLAAAELLRVFTHQRKHSAAQTLSSQQVNMVVDFIEAHLEHNFDLSTMAGVLNLDVFRFARAFKAATGDSPHQFVIGRRLARAKDLVRGSKMPLAEIAYACGFSSQAHMTTTFSNQIGETPGAMRKGAGG